MVEEDDEWRVDLVGRTATHLPSGLVLRFISALDGSGAMTVDLANPERLAAVADDRIMELPMAAWRVYARHSEEALAGEWKG
ncbi:MAG: hypothetical protein HQL76_01075 [Magnetococcales bacterium]|nr:hypothetical protein [Magnetococcales bacterium]